MGTRSNHLIKAILDCSHSGTLLDLDHYFCHWFLRRGTQCRSIPHFSCVHPSISHARGYLALMETMAVDQYDRPSRRRTDDIWERRLVRSATQISRTTSSGAVTAAPAMVRLRTRLAKKQKQPDVVEDSNDSDDAAPRSPGGTIIPRPSCCGGWYCAYALLNGPLVVCMTSLAVFCCPIDDNGEIQISVSSCSDHEVVWEDSQNKGKGMTSVCAALLIKPCVHLCVFIFLEVGPNP